MAVERDRNMPVIRDGHRAPVPSSADAPPPEIGLTGARFGGASRRRRSGPAAADPTPTTTPDAPDAGPVDAGPIGLTGARFGGGSRSRRRAAPSVRPPEPSVRPPEPAVPVPAAEPVRPVPASRVEPDVDPGPPTGPSPYTFVRPYVLTGGRTRAGTEFAVEALITSVHRPRPVGEPVEHSRIRELCREPRSVAEVAALLAMPLGVARVLLADMLAVGSVQVHRTVDAGGPDLALMERVLAGLRRL